MDEDVESPRSDLEGNPKKVNTYLRVGREEYEKFSDLTSEIDRWTFMSSFSTIDYHSDSAKSEILQEYLFHTLHFCVENHLNFPQMSGIVVLAEVVFNNCALCCEVKSEEAITVFRELIKNHVLNSEDPATTVSIPVLKNLSVFFMENFIRHLSLYQLVFSENQKVRHDAKFIALQTPMLFPSLMEATIYNGEDIAGGHEEGGTARSDYEPDGTARTDYTEEDEGE